MSDEFDSLTDDQQDEVARKRIRDLLSKPDLTEEDVQTAAACVAFLGTSFKASDKFAQALLDTAESLTQGLCTRCGEEPGCGPPECLICQGIRSVITLKRVREEAVLVDLEPEAVTEEAPVEIPEMEKIVQLEPVPTPWTKEELNRLDLNRHMSLKALQWVFKDKTPEEIKAKLQEL